MLPSLVPALNATPSLDGSSVTSEQVANLSAPVTPDMQTNLPTNDEWGRDNVRLRMSSELIEEPITEDELESDVSIVIEQYEDWRTALDHFPMVSQEMQQTDSGGRSPEPEAALRAQTPSDAGVELPLEALETLRHLSGFEGGSYRSDSPHSQHEMTEVPNPPSRPKSADGETPASEVSGYSFSELSIPSPGGFFSSLDPDAQDTWASMKPEPDVPSSAVAERFYNLPWDRPSDIMERVIEVDEALTDGPPTARQAEFPASVRDRHSFSSDDHDQIQETTRGQPVEYDESYEEELLKNASANLDRTSVWLSAQTTYLAILKQPDTGEDQQQQADTKPGDHEMSRDSSIDGPSRKRVTFNQDPVTKVDSAIEVPKRNSLFYRGFQYVAHQRTREDAFVHQATRFDAIQAIRMSLTSNHINALLGKYEIVDPWRPPYSGPFSQNPRQTGVFEMTPAQIAFMKVEHEKLALDQLEPASWAIDAMKFLNGGRLLTSPAARRLARASFPLDDPRCVGRNRLRVLDLGGQGSCDWAWTCADQYKNVKVYTVMTKQQVVNPHINGPSNHRIVSVPRLWQLPFKTGHFDLISARTLHSMVRSKLDVGGTTSEFDMCLLECLRVLKPGGYLEFSVMDAAILRAGPRASAMSVEFEFNLRTRGYDPAPSKMFLTRLRRSRFANIRSAWLALPMSVEAPEKQVLRETPFPQCPSVTDLAKYEAVQGPVGSTGNVANVAGLLGGWMWEQWKVKLEKEMGKEQEKWLDGFGNAIEEGRDSGAAYKLLTGYAQKPYKRRQR
ncbi:putative snp3 protein [Phaeomoniella chlamydospora]|uniref:Putative snp3 protein n=1 Tax=Phaeomoniella chlamydospora TaxID=158046 RepID=A0A0G2GKA8_PHACM|nr:putative snp3 protein [Phaeomoniella chlamydospora]